MTSDDDKTQIAKPLDSVAGIVPGGSKPPKATLICEDVTLIDGVDDALEIPLSGDELTVGRSEENAVRIPSKQLSRRHAVLIGAAGGWRVMDLDSKNGTWVNGSSVKEAWLAPGDSLMFGTVPFKYELERPELHDPAALEKQFSQTVVDKTMMVGSDIRAASALLRAAERSAEEASDQAARPKPERPARPSRSKKARSGPRRVAASEPPRAKTGGGWVKKLVAAVVLLAILGGGGYFGWDYLSQGEKRELISQHDREIKRFVKDQETRGDFSEARVEKQLLTLLSLEGSLLAAVDGYPDSPELREQQVKLIFLVFEREMDEALQAGEMDRALELHATAVAAIDEIEIQIPDPGKELGTRLDEVSSLLRLAEAVIAVHVFNATYPSPSETAATKPTQEELDRMREWRTQFVEEKRRSNLALSVFYRYFQEVVLGTERSGLRLIDQWNQVI